MYTDYSRTSYDDGGRHHEGLQADWGTPRLACADAR